MAEKKSNATNKVVSDFIREIKYIIDTGKTAAYASVNRVMITTYWSIGKRIVEEEQKGQQRAEYGTELIKVLAKELTSEYGVGFSERYLRAFRQFYIIVPNFEIWKSRFPNLTWTHVFRTLRVGDEYAIRWYLENASKQMWSVRTLSRNISTQYYERHFMHPGLLEENNKKNVPDKNEIFKSPLVAEFLGFKPDQSLSEHDLEASIISHLRDFMMELGQGFAFVARQQLIRTEAQDYYIDLVFYNVVLKCFVLIDLKAGKITHQDVGQMDMYVRIYDDVMLTEGDNPTIGIVLCSETDQDIAKYSILKDNEHLFATKYKLYLPSEEQLRREIKKQKDLYFIQHRVKD